MLLTKFLLPPLLTTLFVLLLLRNNLRYDRAAESAFNILSGDFEPDEAFLLRPKVRRLGMVCLLTSLLALLDC